MSVRPASFASFASLAVPALAALLPVLGAPSDARANGRFPKAQAIVLPHDAHARADGTTIYLRATFGLLVSHDGGKRWRWLCEQALGFSTTWDPPIAATRDGRLWIALADGARETSDGCAIDDVAALKGELVADLAVDGSGDHVLAVTSSPGKPAFVWRGQMARAGAPAQGTRPAFTRLGKGTSGFHFDTIEVAPSNPSRVYLTATPDGRGPLAHLFRSDDGGATLTELAPAVATDARLFVSAVDPRDPDRIYLRALARTGSDVLLSTDGGKTLTSVLHVKGAMFGFAQTEDGSALYAGSGDPAEGIQRSLDRGATWQAGAKTSVFCLNAEGPRLLVCSNPYVPGGYAVAESSDQGATVTPLATFDDVLGPIECDAGGDPPCAAPWPATRAAIATSAQLRPPSAPGTGGGDASDARDGGDASPTPPAPRASACGCRVAGASGGTPASAAWLAGVALAIGTLAGRSRRARRTARASRHPSSRWW